MHNSASTQAPIVALHSTRAHAGSSKARTILMELRIHAPFTALGTASGIAIMLALIGTGTSARFSAALFWLLHPIHVLFSALVTAGMYRLHSRGRILATLLIGYFGSVGIATLSDSIIPYLGEVLLSLPGRGVHIGMIEKLLATSDVQ